MADKNLKKEYDKRRTHVTLWLNYKEASMLEMQMEKEDWTNKAGFIRYKLFGEHVDNSFAKIIHEADKESIKKVIKNIVQEFNNTVGYLNYRFTYELEQLEKSNLTSEQKQAKITAKMREWRSSVMNRTEEISNDLYSILHLLDIKVERDRKESVRYAPEEVLRKAAKDWNDIDSPEIHELVRRQHEQFRKELGLEDK